MDNKNFVEGFYFKPKHQNAPDFVIGNISAKVGDAVKYLTENANDDGWVNMTIKLSRGGKHYMELDTFQPNAGKNVDTMKQNAGSMQKQSDDESDGLPF